MSKYMAARQGQGADEREALEPKVNAYLTSVLSPDNQDMTIRKQRELKTLALVLDSILAGDVATAGDIVAQRFRAVETAHGMGSWNVAKHMELTGDAKVQSVGRRELEQAAKAEREEYRLKKAMGERTNR